MTTITAISATDPTEIPTISFVFSLLLLSSMGVGSHGFEFSVVDPDENVFVCVFVCSGVGYCSCSGVCINVVGCNVGSGIFLQIFGIFVTVSPRKVSFSYVPGVYTVGVSSKSG